MPRANSNKLNYEQQKHILMEELSRISNTLGRIQFLAFCHHAYPAGLIRELLDMVTYGQIGNQPHLEQNNDDNQRT